MRSWRAHSLLIISFPSSSSSSSSSSMSCSSSSIWGYSWSYFWTFYVSTIVHCPPAPGVWGLGRIGGRPSKSKALPAGLASWHGQWEHWAWISHDSPEEIETSGHFPGHSANFTANLARFHMCDIFEYVWSHFLDLIISDISRFRFPTLTWAHEVPMSPQTHEGVHYNWACAFRKQQNKKQLGAVHCFTFHAQW